MYHTALLHVITVKSRAVSPFVLACDITSTAENRRDLHCVAGISWVLAPIVVVASPVYIIIRHRVANKLKHHALHQMFSCIIAVEKQNVVFPAFWNVCRIAQNTIKWWNADALGDTITQQHELESRPLEWRSAGTGLCSCRVRGVDGSCTKHLTVESYMVIYASNSYTYYYY